MECAVTVHSGHILVTANVLPKQVEMNIQKLPLMSADKDAIDRELRQIYQMVKRMEHVR